MFEKSFSKTNLGSLGSNIHKEAYLLFNILLHDNDSRIAIPLQGAEIHT